MEYNLALFTICEMLLACVRKFGETAVLENNEHSLRHIEYNEAVIKCARGYIIVFSLMKVLDYPYGIRLNHSGLKTTIHYVMIGVRTIIGLYFFVEILSKQIWIIFNTFFIIFTNWWKYDELKEYKLVQSNSPFNMVLCWILWFMIISVISAL